MKAILLFIAIIFFFSCNNKRTDDSNNPDSVLKIDLLSEPETTVSKLSDFATTIDYIPLQTTQVSLMGRFSLKIINSDKGFFILNDDEIFLFDLNGKFLFKLNKSGRGPEEFLSITDFDVSHDNKFLSVYSGINKKIVLYSIHNSGFSFHKSISLGDPAPYRVAMVPETDKIFLSIPPWSGTEPSLSLLINAEGDTVHFKPNCYKYDMLRTRKSMALNEMIVYSFENIVCFKEEFSDTLFYADAQDNLFKPRIIFDSHGTLLKAEMRGSPERPKNNTTCIFNIFETSRYAFYWYEEIREKPFENLVIYDRNTKTKSKIDVDSSLESRLKDDLSGGPDFNIEFLRSYCSGGKLFSLVEAITLKNYVAGSDFENSFARDKKKKNELKKLADSLNDNDNPVLIIVTPKE